jgi:hypothetical protein
MGGLNAPGFYDTVFQYEICDTSSYFSGTCAACQPCQTSSLGSKALDVRIDKCSSGAILVGDACITCPVGKFSLNQACANCPVGSFSNSGGLTYCSQRPSGFFLWHFGILSLQVMPTEFNHLYSQFSFHYRLFLRH